jgi:hypothetical protein
MEAYSKCNEKDKIMPEFNPNKLKEIYDNGFRGVRTSTREDIKFRRSVPTAYKANPRLAELGAGKLSLSFLAILKLDSGFGSTEAQTTGDCVAHATRNAGSIDYALDVLFGETEFEGRFASENIYGARGHSGQGANCSTLAKYVSPQGPGGFLTRKKYKSGSNSIDLSVYKSSIGHNWGRTGTPDWLNRIADDNKAMSIYRATNLDMARDTIAAGYGLSCCSGYGFSNQRNGDGVANRQGSWSHAMAWIACDDTEWAHDNYGGPLFLVQNSWGRWNSGGKRHNQPDGSFWIKSKDADLIIRSGASYAVCAIEGIDRIHPVNELDYTMI